MSQSRDAAAGAQGHVRPDIYPVVTRPSDDAPAMYHDDPSYTETYAKLYDWTWAVPVSAPARALYCYILHRIGANKEAKAWPRRRTIAEALRIGERALHKYLHELEDQGLIRIHNFDAKDGRPSEYYAQTKQAVAARQSLLQNLQEVPPLAKSARAPRKICKSPLQNVQGNKGYVDTEKQIQKTDTGSVGADKPRPPRPGHKPAIDLLLTDHDGEATVGHKLALKLARDVLGCKTASPKMLARYEAFCDGLLDRGWQEDDLRAWMDWMDSGAQYWRGKAYLFKEDAMLIDLCAWDGQDRPEVKAEPVGRSHAGRRLDPAEQASRQAQAGYEARYGN